MEYASLTGWGGIKPPHHRPDQSRSNPLFPALRSSPAAFSGATRKAKAEAR